MHFTDWHDYAGLMVWGVQSMCVWHNLHRIAASEKQLALMIPTMQNEANKLLVAKMTAKSLLLISLHAHE
jgi:hypothetical protein